MNLSEKILTSITDKINSGYPNTALATANNYLHENCPIREAIATKVRLKILQIPKLRKDELIVKMLAGSKLSQRQIARTIKQYDKSSTRIKKYVPKTSVRSQNGRRGTSRIRDRIRWDSPRLGYVSKN